MTGCIYHEADLDGVMSRRWHARPTHVEEAIRRLPDSSLAWRI